ncbi:MAG: DUF4936 family protein [Burkholderiaceae bacterium]|nr:DUF4936 family protein [Burkholderiaceae bacterium]
MSHVVMVWFRADRAQDRACAERLSLLGRRMAGAQGVEARSGWRDEPGYRTWLETYEPLGAGGCDAFIGALQAAAKELGLDALAMGGRHVEVFEWSA